MKPYVENPYGFLKVFGREFGRNMVVFALMLTMFWFTNEYMVSLAIKRPSMFHSLVAYDAMMSCALIWLWSTMHHDTLLFVDEVAHLLFKREHRVSLFD